MAGFDLLPVDDSGSPIHLPEGETVLGRGPFFGVSDKRVSRHHGLLESLGGQLRIKPTHLNPCFCQSSLNEPPQPLDRDQWHTLKQGYIFSLLPGKYMYKVLAVGGEDGTLRKSQDFQDDVHGKTAACPEPSEEHHPVTQQGKVLTLQEPFQEQEPTLGATAGKDTEEEGVSDPTQNQNKAVMVEDKESVNEHSPEPKKRVLPAWMMAATTTPKSPSTPKAAGNRSRGASTPATSTKRAAPKRARAAAPSSGEESGHSEAEQTPRKRVRKKKSDEDGEAHSQTARKATLEVKVSRAEDSDESDNLHPELQDDLQQTIGGATSAAEVSRSPSRVEPGDSEESRPQTGRGAKPGGSNGEPGPAQPKAQRRTPCPYGGSCYRKNPLHFQECSHPGESDYEEPMEEEDADRPECPYGADCYRKNPLHWKEYSHSATRAKRSVRKNYNDDDEEEDDDLGDEDSFINDESEDIGDDSDYVPPDSGDSGKEDIKILQKEAKAFVKRQK